MCLPPAPCQPSAAASLRVGVLAGGILLEHTWLVLTAGSINVGASSLEFATHLRSLHTLPDYTDPDAGPCLGAHIYTGNPDSVYKSSLNTVLPFCSFITKPWELNPNLSLGGSHCRPDTLGIPE